MSGKKKNTLIALVLLLGLIGVAMYIMGFGNRPTHLNADEAMNMMASTPNAILLDVREQEEYDKKHIPNAVLLPIEKINAGQDIETTLPDKNRPILVYCQTGRRAENAASKLAKMGYKHVYEFGGLVEWNGPLVGED